MSEDEQAGRWETTPSELKDEVRRLRASLERVRELMGPKHREAFVMQGPRALIPIYNEVCATLDAPGLKTD